MDLYHNLDSDDDFINFFCDVLEDLISPKAGYKVSVGFKKHDMSIFFFIDGSSILQVMPDKDLQYTYAHIPSYEEEIQLAIITEIIKKES